MGQLRIRVAILLSRQSDSCCCHIVILLANRNNIVSEPSIRTQQTLHTPSATYLFGAHLLLQHSDLTHAHARLKQITARYTHTYPFFDSNDETLHHISIVFEASRQTSGLCKDHRGRADLGDG